MRCYLSCVENGVEALIYEHIHIPKYKFIIRSYDDLCKLSDIYKFNYIICSSSMDFPEENTKEQWVIDLCNEIRSFDNE